MIPGESKSVQELYFVSLKYKKRPYHLIPLDEHPTSSLKLIFPPPFVADKLLATTRWQTIHRTRQGSSIPATACPAGANAIISVISSALEVLVYTADALPSLRPTYGGAPCPREGNSTTTSDIDFDGDYTTEDRAVNVDGRADQNGPVDFGSDDEERGDSTKERKYEKFSSGEYIYGKWPHEPRYCAKLWPEEGDSRNGSSDTSAPRQEEGLRSYGSSNRLVLFRMVASSSVLCHRIFKACICRGQVLSELKNHERLLGRTDRLFEATFVSQAPEFHTLHHGDDDVVVLLED